MTNRETGVAFERGPFERSPFERGPFELEALSNETAQRQTPISPFGDFESPLMWSPETEASPFEASEALESSRLDAPPCPHCGRELDETHDDHEAPFVGEGYLGATELYGGEIFHDAEWDAEWNDGEQEAVEPLFEAESEFASLSPSELKAVRITSTFETGRPGGFGGLSGNFDKQGLSFGLMNWTIGTGSLIPLLKKFITEHTERYRQIFGSDAARFQAMVFATRFDPKEKANVIDTAAQLEFVRGKMNDAAQKNIIEPWKTYFNGLENDPSFRAIEVATARGSLVRARGWFDRFGWKTERGFVFMFDLVSSHGGAWLDAPKFKGYRQKLLAERTAAKKTELGRDPNELETMAIIANLIADLSLEEWRAQVRIRKMWFVNGAGTVHGSYYDLAKHFGVTDRPADFGVGITSGTTAAAPSISTAASTKPTAFEELATVYSAISRGTTDSSKLTNAVFFARHPELGGRAIRAGETSLANEWTAILRDIVQPALAQHGAGGAPSPSPSPSPRPVAPATAPSPAASPSPTSTVEVLGVDTSVGWDLHGHPDSFAHDWAKARSLGVTFSIPRACEGTTHDPGFAKDWRDMKAAGIVRGGYLFLRFPHPNRGKPPTPEAQANELVKVLDAAGIDDSDFPPVLDVEFPGYVDKKSGKELGGLSATGMSKAAILAGVRSAWNVLKDRYKVAPMIYTSYRVWLETLPKDDAVTDLVESPLWVTPYYVGRHLAPLLDPAKVAKLTFGAVNWYPAAWNRGPRHDPPVPTPWGDTGNWWIHQYQGDALHFPGFSGDIDMNRFHTMMPGETGNRVKWVQRRLGLAQSGSFDTTMESALKSFRTSKGLSSDAVVDVATFARLCWVRV